MLKQQKQTKNQALHCSGFTLVEVMVATLIFSVGMMAVITMEFSALRAYSASHHMTSATMIADKTVATVKMERSNWRLTDFNQVFMLNPVYTGPDAPIDINMLSSVKANPWTWMRASPEPLTDNMVRDTELGQYCIYVRGADQDVARESGEGDNAGMPQTVTPTTLVHVAVIYPTKSTSFAAPDCTSLRCEGTGDQLVADLLQPSGIDTTATGDAAIPQLERCGWRAVYTSTLVTR